MSVNVTPASTTSPTVSTSGDSKLVTARDLYAVSHRLDDAVNILNDCAAVFSDPSSSDTKRSDHINHINNLVIPLLRLCAFNVLKSAKYVSPIPAIKTVCDRLEKKSAAKIIKPNKRKSASVQLLQHFITPIAPRLYERSTKRRRTTRSQASADEEIDVPEPSNCNVYTRLEMLENLEKIDERSGLRKKAIAKMMELGYCPYKASSGIYKALRKRKEGTDRLDDEWIESRGGRPSILNEDDINEVAELIKRWRGRSVGKDEINYLLVNRIKKKIRDADHVPTNVPDELSNTTLDRYIAQLAIQAGVSIVSSSVPKTNNRFTAENSIRGSISNVALAAGTHFIAVSEEDGQLSRRLESLSEEDKLLYELCRKARPNVALVPIRPHLLFSTDDTTQFIFEGSQDQPDAFRLVSSESLASRGTDSVYHNDECKNANGMRVKITHTFCAVGRSAPILITVTGLPDSEFLGDEDVLIVKVPGLCIGGGGVGANQEVGYLCFQRKASGADQKRFQYYQQHVLLPFINAMREECCDSFDASACMTVPEELTAVSYQDGDIPQTNATLENADLWVENKVIVNKHNSGRTGIDQPADRMDYFKRLPAVTSATTVEGIDAELHPMKKRILEALKGGKLSCIKLRPKTERSLVDFLSCLPEIITKTLSRDCIVKGFVSTGLIDKTLTVPVFGKLMSNCKRAIPQKIWDGVIDNFPTLLNGVLDHGHIPDDVYDEFDFDRDVDANGIEVIKCAGISNEKQQRSKCITHQHQVQLRKAHVEKIEAEGVRKKVAAKEKKNLKLQSLQRTIQKIQSIVASTNPNVDHDELMEHADLEDFDKLRSPELAEFILAFDPKVNLTKEVPPHKGKLAIAKEALENETPITDVDSRTLWAWSCRTNEIKECWKIAEDAHDGGSDADTLALDVESAEPPEPNAAVAEIVLDGVDCNMIKPSDLLSSPIWVSSACRLFRIDRLGSDPISTVTQDEKDRADLLVKILRGRMHTFMNRRKVSKGRSKHWAITLAIKNMSVAAAYMILSGHVVDDLTCLDETECLLTSKTSQFTKCLLCVEHEGAYLYHDANKGVWIRSGKVVGRGFVARNSEHLKEAAKPKPSSDFYHYYPTSDCARAKNSRAKRGLFDKLIQYVAAGFDSNSEVASYLNKGHDNGGILVIDADDADNIRASMKQNPNELYKFRSFLAYQMELGYDVALAPASNVSNSFGFEGFVGLFGV